MFLLKIIYLILFFFNFTFDLIFASPWIAKNFTISVTNLQNISKNLSNNNKNIAKYGNSFDKIFDYLDLLNNFKKEILCISFEKNLTNQSSLYNNYVLLEDKSLIFQAHFKVKLLEHKNLLITGLLPCIEIKTLHHTQQSIKNTMLGAGIAVGATKPKRYFSIHLIYLQNKSLKQISAFLDIGKLFFENNEFECFIINSYAINLQTYNKNIIDIFKIIEYKNNKTSQQDSSDQKIELSTLQSEDSHQKFVNIIKDLNNIEFKSSFGALIKIKQFNLDLNTTITNCIINGANNVKLSIGFSIAF